MREPTERAGRQQRGEATQPPAKPVPAIIPYFCAAELLANVAKRSGARHVTLQVTSPAGGATVVAIELPSHA
jgi:hypothetical protein